MAQLAERAASAARSEVSQSGEAALELDRLCKVFGKHQAVRSLSLSLAQGEIFGLLGPNGSGKTTTINMVSGLSKPSSGSVRMLGYDVWRSVRQVRRLMGVVPQETALYEELSAQANMEFHADLYGVPRSEKRERIERLLDLVSLADRRQSRVSSYSGGMKRRLAIARALLHEPRILFLDEPTLGVDVQSRSAIWGHIRALRDQGRTILLTTNYLEEAQALCDRLAIIDHGELLVVGSPASLRQQYGSATVVATLECFDPLDLVALSTLPGVTDAAQDGQQVTIRTSGVETPFAEIVGFLSQQNKIKSIVCQEPTLDDVFLHLTGEGLRD